MGFGTAANPGYRLGWFGVGPTDYWVEDPASSVYNTHQQGPSDESQAPWGHFERLIDQPVAYQYSVLINFNVPAHGARGSGIFLHVVEGGADRWMCQPARGRAAHRTAVDRCQHPHHHGPRRRDPKALSG